MSDPVLAPMTADVLDQVAEIEKSGGDVHWSRAQFEKELYLPFSRFFVLREGINILGYGGYWKVEEEAQIMNLAVAPDQRLKGWGRYLLSQLLDHARSDGCRRVTLEVRSKNPAAQALYLKNGFNKQGHRPQAYTDPLDDAILMEKRI